MSYAPKLVLEQIRQISKSGSLDENRGAIEYIKYCYVPNAQNLLQELHENILINHLGACLLGDTVIDSESARNEIRDKVFLSDIHLCILNRIGGPIQFEEKIRFKLDDDTFQDGDEYISLKILYGLGDSSNSIESKMEEYKGRMPAQFVSIGEDNTGYYVPIGEDNAGNVICIDQKGYVYFWDCANLSDDEPTPIASSFDSFLNKLEVDKGNYNVNGTRIP